MTLNDSQIALFASTIGGGLGSALMVHAVGSSDAGVAAWVGATLAMTGLGGFVVAAVYGMRRNELGPFSGFLAVVLGVLTIWFWLVPGRVGYAAAACELDNLSACTASARHGGFAERIAYDNERWVETRCVAGDAKLCRIAATQRDLHPAKFCPRIELADEFEVVEWCTRSEAGDSLVARR